MRLKLEPTPEILKLRESAMRYAQEVTTPPAFFVEQELKKQAALRDNPLP